MREWTDLSDRGKTHRYQREAADPDVACGTYLDRIKFVEMARAVQWTNDNNDLLSSSATAGVR